MSKMNSAELDGDLWTIPGDRYKTGLDHVIPLSAEALALIGNKPADVKKNAWFIFSTTNGAKPFSGFGRYTICAAQRARSLAALAFQKITPSAWWGMFKTTCGTRTTVMIF